MSNEAIISVDNLQVRFGKKDIVSNFSFDIQKGEIIGILGISGAGKTTVIRVLTCQVSNRYWKGSVQITGHSPKKPSSRKKILAKIGYVPQFERTNLYFQLKPLENVEIFASTYGLSKKEAHKKAEELFNILDIPQDTLKNPVKRMSGGERKRLSMSLGLLNSPEILFLDEPTTGVDASKRYQILNYLKRLNEELKVTMLIITHDLEAANICDKVAILRAGELLEFNSPKKLIQSLPSKGKMIRVTFDNLNIETIEQLEKISFVKIVSRVGVNTVEVFMANIDKNLAKFVERTQKLNVKILELSQELAPFQSYFKLRVEDKSGETEG
ncbi:MAG: ABC transporter ATP-binding protein [Candidatus Odinarchaeota archaeon]